MLASIRDYDSLLETKPPVQGPAFYSDDGRRRIVHQVWDWIEERRYALHLYITRELEAGWDARHYVAMYRAILRDELTRMTEAAGFSRCHWIFPAESGFYQPMLVAIG